MRLEILPKKYWLEIPNHFLFVELGNFEVKPNHTHRILIIDKNGISNNPIAIPSVNIASNPQSRCIATPLRVKFKIKHNQFSTIPLLPYLCETFYFSF